MPRLTIGDKLERIHAEALKEFDEIIDAQWPERQQALADRRFCSVTGAQWDGDAGELFARKVRFEFNQVHLAVIRIVNEYRNNRVAVTFGSPDGEKDEMADHCAGLLRADEKRCSAIEAYDNAFEEACQGGMGAWRLRACKEDEDDEDNDRDRVVVEPIHDAESTVFFNLGAKRQDKSDAKRCYVLIPYSPDDYREEFGDDPDGWDKSITQTKWDWATKEIVWVCEHYRIDTAPEKIVTFEGIDGEEKEFLADELDPELLDELRATGYQQTSERTQRRRVVRKYLLSGGWVLKDCGVIAGKHIPIIPVYGKRWVVDGVERFMGHVRLARDAQMLINMLMSWLAEMAARFDVEKPIFTAEQIARHAQMWADDNIERFPYLLTDSVKDAAGNPIASGPIGYTKAPNVPPAMAALLQLAQGALEALLGNQAAGEKLEANQSGKAVELIQNRLDMQVFIYMSNFARAMKRSGEVWLSMMRDIAVESKRKMKTIAADGTPGSIELNKPGYDKEKGDYVENDMSRAMYDVDADVGPSSSSLRSAVVRALTGVAAITDDPETKQALTLATIANLEGEGLGGLRDWARQKGIRMGIIEPTEEERMKMDEEKQNQKPDPQAQYLQAEAAKSASLAKKAAADTLLTQAKTEQSKAETADTLAGISHAERQQAIDAAIALAQASRQPSTATEGVTSAA